MSERHQGVSLDQIQNFSGKYPKQLWYLFFTEMWERFCFYGMRGILAIFMVDKIAGLSLTGKEANLQYAAIQAFVYAFTFIGGMFADKLLGFKKSLLYGGLLMILGNFIIGLSPQQFFYVGITLTIIGTGFFKPNVSSMVGELYKEGDNRRDAGVYLGKYVSWSSAFFAASFVMVIGLITFVITKKHLGNIGDSPLSQLSKSEQRRKELLVYVISLLCIPVIYILVQDTNYTDYFMYAIAPLAIGYFLFELMKLKDTIARRKLLSAFVFIFFYFLFNAIYEQSGGSLALFAEQHLTHQLLFFNIDPNIVNNSSNALFVILLSPVIGSFWLWLNNRKLEPNSVVKFAIGFLFLAGSFYVFYNTKFFADINAMTSLNIFTLGYLVTTIGELCLGPIGMSLVTKLSPKRVTGMMMGMWFLASAFGQFAAGKLGAQMSIDESAAPIEKLNAYTNGFMELALYALIAGVFLFLISPLIKKMMAEVR
jgi:POT family proton-dependent oligopeptide transporter